MPDAKDNAKASGDVHAPDVDDMDGLTSPAGRPQAEGAGDTQRDGSLSRDQQDEGRAGKGINQAGYLKDQDAPGTGGSEKS